MIKELLNSDEFHRANMQGKTLHEGGLLFILSKLSEAEAKGETLEQALETKPKPRKKVKKEEAQPAEAEGVSE